MNLDCAYIGGRSGVWRLGKPPYGCVWERKGKRLRGFGMGNGSDYRDMVANA